MKIKYSALVSDMRGKLNGSVASKNRFGSYLRNKVTPVNRKTVYQTVVRAILATVAQTWRGLTASQRSQWDGAVNSFKGTNIFGDVKVLSGFGLFTKLNANRLTIGQAQITTPPLPTDVPGVTALSATADVSDAKIILTYSPAIDAGVSVILEATAPMSAGKNFVDSEYRKIDVLLTADASPLEVQTAYIAKFGSIGVAGQKIFFRMKAVDTSSGIPGGSISASCVVTA